MGTASTDSVKLRCSFAVDRADADQLACDLDAEIVTDDHDDGVLPRLRCREGAGCCLRSTTASAPALGAHR